MSNYKYVNPIDMGFVKFTLTKKQHNELFQYRQLKWYDKYEYYYSHDYIIIHKFYSTPIIFLNIILFPILIFMEGYSEAKRISIRALNQKKYGSFISDTVSRGAIRYGNIMDIVKKNIEDGR